MFENYQKYWTNRFIQRRKILLNRREELRIFANSCARVLDDQFHVQKVCLVGSLAKTGSVFREDSDIDLVVFGLAPEKYFRALANLKEILPKDIEINLIPYEFANERMAQVVTYSGEVLIEK